MHTIMKKDKSTVDITNIQYSRKDTPDGNIKLAVNGHIDNEYYETVIEISPAIMDDPESLKDVLENSLLDTREKTSKLRAKQ